MELNSLKGTPINSRLGARVGQVIALRTPMTWLVNFYNKPKLEFLGLRLSWNNLDSGTWDKLSILFLHCARLLQPGRLLECQPWLQEDWRS